MCHYSFLIIDLSLGLGYYKIIHYLLVCNFKIYLLVYLGKLKGLLPILFL